MGFGVRGSGVRGFGVRGSGFGVWAGWGGNEKGSGFGSQVGRSRGHLPPLTPRPEAAL